MCYIFLLIFSTFIHSNHPVPATAHLSVTGLKSTKGHLAVAVYQNDNGFPNDDARAIRKLYIPVKEMQDIVEIPDLMPGEYAFVLLHDENSNRKLDKNFIGIPKEGVGFSNNPSIAFGPPSYKKSACHIGDIKGTVVVKMKYF